MSRNPNAGHRGNGTHKRCWDCEHRPGRRQVTATSKKSSGGLMAPRFHKKPCDCVCHVEAS